ncbi:hypothetical protein N7925_35775 [Streptomyces sp. CA-278952]|uniref:hypothetical protein n=1 Tax=unclassified Streptomyces TaxID=2593676 RepID=UPI002367DC7B|nr:hypothetical protein [Streptomyces sp. CA-278952]WDG33309.1 hypothetical protein N7925_35775 [Streptomyces sp. CA-278952]
MHRAFIEIKRQWDSLLTEPDLPEQAWNIMRRTVLDEVLGTFRESLPFMDSDIGLYPAMCKLSPRQYDAVVLKAIGKYDTKHIAWYRPHPPQHGHPPLAQGPGTPGPHPPPRHTPDPPEGRHVNTTPWEQLLADAGRRELRRPFDVGAGLRRLAHDDGRTPAAARGSTGPNARRGLGAWAQCVVNHPGAAAHVERLTALLGHSDEREGVTEFDGWTGGVDIDGVQAFACHVLPRPSPRKRQVLVAVRRRRRTQRCRVLPLPGPPRSR